MEEETASKLRDAETDPAQTVFGTTQKEALACAAAWRTSAAVTVMRRFIGPDAIECVSACECA